MSLIRCPECGNSISDKAEKCPHCGLPAAYFSSLDKEAAHVKEGLDYKNLQNVLISFERDHAQLFSAEHYISHRDAQRLRDTYGKYSESLNNKLIFQYVCNNAAAIRVDIDLLRRFLRRMQSLDADITAHNTTYVDRILEQDKDYFDNILKQIDPNIQLDEEQRRAVITDDDYCLLVAGAGAGKTTTMAAKVKYLVEKKNIDPEEIIVISYTNKAIGELRDRINKGLGIPAKICTFHAFAYDIVKQFSAEPPEINFSSQQIIFDMLEKSIFHNKQLMRNLVLFLGYYFDLSEDVFKFTDLNQYHLYKAAQDFETLKSGLIDIAGGFVQRNSSQIRKQLISPKHLENPIVLEVFDDSVKPMEQLANTIEHIIGEIISEYGERSSILLIGRYNYDMYKLYRTNRFSELPGGAIRSEKYPNAKITFMTAHSSKGLGYDNVILINMFEGKFGFPCQIEDDPIIKLVTYEDNSMPFAEERRLFYVAMTRTKNRVYIAAPKTKPSRFLVELIKDFNIPHNDEINMQVVDLFNLRCPICGFPLKYEFNKNYGLNLWICTNEAELCDFMTNDRVHMHDILKCPKCADGYLIVKKNPKNGDIFYGCTNFFNEEKKCTNMVPLERGNTRNDQ